MKFCIAFLFQNEASWLKLHLPLWTKANIHGLIGLDGGSDDNSAEIVKSFGGTVFKRQFDWDFAAHGNCLIDHAEKAGYDCLLRLDCDEAMFPDDIDKVRFNLDYKQIVALPRYNFVKDRLHHNPDWHPDFQRRAWRLNCKVSYPNYQRVHEVPAGLPIHILDGVHIYHYGWIADPDTLAQKSVKYAQMAGEEVEYSGGGEYPPYEPFPTSKPQPHDPEEIGLRAPLETANGAV